MPTIPLGKSSVAFVVTFFLLIAVFLVLVASGQRGRETFLDNLVLAVPGFLGGICGVLAFFIGIVGIARSRERSAGGYLATAVGSFVLFFLLGEFLSPH